MYATTDCAPAAAVDLAAQAATDVHELRDLVEMSWIHTQFDATRMIELEPLADRTDEELVNDPMSAMHSALTADEMHLPVSLTIGRCRPEPAVSRPTDVNLGPDAGRQSREVQLSSSR